MEDGGGSFTRLGLKSKRREAEFGGLPVKLKWVTRGESPINAPDILALIRIALVPVIMAFTRSDSIDHALGIAATLFSIAAFTDFLDGYVARRTTGGTTLGAFLDTTADKILVTGT